MKNRLFQVGKNYNIDDFPKGKVTFPDCQVTATIKQHVLLILSRRIGEDDFLREDTFISVHDIEKELEPTLKLRKEAGLRVSKKHHYRPITEALDSLEKEHEVIKAKSNSTGELLYSAIHGFKYYLHLKYDASMLLGYRMIENAQPKIRRELIEEHVRERIKTLDRRGTNPRSLKNLKQNRRLS